MYRDVDLVRIKSIKQKLDDIRYIINRHNGIVNALNDIERQPAILMLLVAVSEQFSKLYEKKF